MTGEALTEQQAQWVQEELSTLNQLERGSNRMKPLSLTLKTSDRILMKPLILRSLKILHFF